ncbi:MAG: formyl-CoA transferase [Gammaproteobacteria bacterium]|uniref:Formyl-CoA transferase n=1 Tax=OM182 bacterium MED-G24 TaxID=1986255 RepID=A0A2A5WIU1_9GAMM|nr:formyl-CoA transferase [Gammaproteobacteria bacterium]PDH36168.1 MAG: formyl-CoA transferase [OM182 bacterium MED-G24]RPG24129.1 MAG: CoA transferase [Gammaproteobacteria bacterium TMED50]|tara:strand:- start:2029 stop:3216 length:1188 start_codon:yes stop_codon:yes gene_type:complete
MTQELPLSSYTVLDLTIARAGPTAVRLLADWGANVIRVEPPPSTSQSLTGPSTDPDYQNLHRNKRGLAINLKSSEGAALFKSLVAKADIVVENFRADVKRRLGIGYEQLRAINKRVILASISGFGQTGPYSDRPGVDQIVQGTSGLMSITGQPGYGPVRAGIAISDTSAGMFLGQGILLALLDRERTGEGQWVHTSLLEAMLCKIDFQGARYTMSGEVPEQQGNFHPTQVPMGTFEASDGLVNIAASSPKMWHSFCEALDAQSLFEHPDYQDYRGKIEHREQLNEDVNAVTRTFTVQELVERLNPVGCPCGPIYDVGEAYDDPQAQYLKMTKPAPHTSLGDVNLIRSPINLSRLPHAPRFHRAGPATGEHTEEILAEFGYSPEEIEALKTAGAIA